MITPQLHEYTVRLHPTPAQDAALRRLGWGADLACGVAYELAARQHVSGEPAGGTSAVAIPQSPDAGIDADVAALRTLLPERDFPVGIVRYAVINGQRAYREGHPRPAATTVTVAADDLLTPAPGGMVMTGVPGVVRAEVARLPRWAAAVWRRAAGDAAADPELDVSGATPTTFGYISLEDDGWLVDVMIRWDAHPEGRLRPRWEDGALSPERLAIATLMGW